MDGLLRSHDEDQPIQSSTECRRFVDMFRWLHPNTTQAFTNWCTVTGARATNYGCRLDYIIADVGLIPSFVHCDIMANIEGSDHCPVRAEFNMSVLPARKCPQLCTKYLPQFAGRQQKLATFFERRLETRRERQQVWSDNGPQTVSEYGSQCSRHSSQDRLTPSETAVLSGKRCAVTTPADVFCDGNGSSKKLKSCDNKQSSLLTFFNKHSLVSNRVSQEPVLSRSTSVVPDNRSIGLALDTLSQDTAGQLCNGDTASKWRMLLTGPPPAPLCRGHNEPCVLRTVKKDGPNKGKQFWVCCKPEGPKNNSEARCDHFVWVTSKK